MSWEGDKRRKSDIDIEEIKLNLAILIKSQDNITKLLEKHNEVIYGNGEPGLKTQVDRLEQHRMSAEKHTLVAWTAAIGLVCKTAWDVLTKR